MRRQRAALRDIENIRDLLRADETAQPWIEHLEEIGDPDFDVSLPSAIDLPPILRDLGVPHEDTDALIAMLPSCEHAPHMWWLLERCVHSLVQSTGSVERPPWFPDLPESVNLSHPYFYVYVFLAALPHVQDYHRARQIPEDIARHTLVDLGRHMAVHRWHHGTGGMNAPFWLTLHFRGMIYDLGRLQFERVKLGNTMGKAIAAAGLPYGPGDPALSVHIPDFCGPMMPEACDASFARATAFFPRYFPEETYELAVCYSWLLDDQLAEYLPETSNVIRFQRRFHLAHKSDEPSDASIVRFVFGLPSFVPDELPRRTSLERAIGDHLRAGHHWYSGSGWLRL